MKGVDTCEQISTDSRDEKIPGEAFAKEIVRSGSGPLVFDAVRYRKDASAAFMIQMKLSSSQDVVSAR